MKKKDTLNEVGNINGSKVFIENGEVKTILSEAIQQSRYMSVEDTCHAQNMHESKELIHITKPQLRKIIAESVKTSLRLYTLLNSCVNKYIIPLGFSARNGYSNISSMSSSEKSSKPDSS